MRLVAGTTTEPRIRINRPDDENVRCRVLRVQVQPKDFSQPTQPHTTLSTSNAISSQEKRTEPSGLRRCRRGAKSSLRRERDVPADSLRCDRATNLNLTERRRSRPANGNYGDAQRRCRI